MIFQYTEADISWVIGLGLMFGFAFLFTLLISPNIKVFFGFSLIFNGIVVYGGLLESWTMILSLIVCLVMLVYDRQFGMIGMTLGILLVLTVLSVVSGGSFSSGISEGTISNEVIINGTTTTIDYEGINTTFGIDPLLGGLTILVAVITIASIVGIQVLGSGLADASVSTIRTVIMYTGLWATLSLLPMPLISSIELYGLLIYIILTILFVIGVFRQVSGGGT